jgi:ABC-type Fe3+-hydroxamate transport system substrate-binding protein
MTPILTGEDVRGLDRPPSRVVSLVPSLTDSLYALDLAGALVGVTNYCQPPAGARVARVGGTRDFDPNIVLSLEPDLVLANQEENGRGSLDILSAADVPVWLTFPKTVPEAMAILWDLVSLFRSERGTERLKALEVAIEWTSNASAQQEKTTYFCPIWKSEGEPGSRWLMTFNRATYCHDVLARCGGENVFASREGRYPLAADLGRDDPEPAGDRDTRYPRVTMDEVRAASPAVILLPDEPYAFGVQEAEWLREALSNTPAIRGGRIYLVDGRHITWHGTRVGGALTHLPPIFQADPISET